MSEMSLQEVCRLCLSKDNLVWVFDARLDRTDHMKDVILITTGVEIHSKDVISQKICTKCGQDVIKMFQFRQQSLKNDKHLKEQCRQILKSTDLKIPNTNVTIKTEKVEKVEVKQEFECPKPSYKVHPSVAALSQKYPNLQFPSICILSNVSPCVSLEMDAVERYFQSRKLNMNDYVQFAKPSDKRNSKKTSNAKKSSVSSESKVGPINIKMVQTGYEIVPNPRKRKLLEDAVSEPVTKKIPAPDPSCSNQPKNTVVKPDVKMKNDGILDSFGNKVPNLGTIQELLSNIDKLQSMSDDGCTQTEFPTADSIKVNMKNSTAELKNLKSVLHSYKIPVTIRNGPMDVSYSSRPIRPKSDTMKLWNELPLIDIKAKKQAVGDQNSNSEDVNTETPTSHFEVEIVDSTKPCDLSNQNNTTVVQSSSNTPKTQTAQAMSTPTAVSAEVPTLASLLATSPPVNSAETQISCEKNPLFFPGGTFNDLEIIPVPVVTPTRKNPGTEQTSLRNTVIQTSSINSGSREGSPKQATAPMSYGSKSVCTSFISSDSRVKSPMQAKSAEIGTVNCVNPFQIPDTQVKSPLQAKSSCVNGNSFPVESIYTSNDQHEFSNFPMNGGNANSSALIANSLSARTYSTKQSPHIKTYTNPKSKTIHGTAVSQTQQDIANYYENNFPGTAYSSASSQEAFGHTPFQSNRLHQAMRPPPPPYPTSKTPAVRRNHPHSLPYMNTSNGASAISTGGTRESLQQQAQNFYEYHSQAADYMGHFRTTVRPSSVYYPPAELYRMNDFHASNVLRQMRPLVNGKDKRLLGVSKTSGSLEVTALPNYSSTAISSSTSASWNVAVDSLSSSERQLMGSIRVRNVYELT